MTGEAQLERQALSDTLVKVGPAAPTLCHGWSTRDLTAHLVVRERRPDAVPGVLIPRFSGHTERVQRSYAEREWTDLVHLFRTGPPNWSPLRRGRGMHDLVNLGEHFVHHEDVLRAQPGWSPQQARALPDEVSLALWGRLRAIGQLLYRGSEVGVVLVSPVLGRKTVHADTKAGSVVISGTPAELTMYSFGRRTVATVEIFGSDSAIELLHGTDLAL